MMFIPVVLLVAAIFGIVAASAEANERRNNLLIGNFEPLNHKRLVIERIVVGSIFFGLLLMVSGVDLRLLLLTIPFAGTFAITHRLSFNSITAKGPYYMGVDSHYDRYFLDKIGLNYQEDSSDHFYDYIHGDYYGRRVKMAGAAAYLFEASVSLLFIYITYQTLA